MGENYKGGIIMVKMATTTGALVDIYRNKATKKAMIRYGYIEIGLSDTEALRLGSTLANTMSVNHGMFPNFMNGCGFYDNDENPTRLVLIINIGKVTADDYLMSVWSDEDMATKLFGIDVNRIRKWIDILYDVENPKGPNKAKAELKEKEVDISKFPTMDPAVGGAGNLLVSGNGANMNLNKLREIYNSADTPENIKNMLNEVYKAVSDTMMHLN